MPVPSPARPSAGRPTAAPTRVLFIGGEGRSGSTVLERRLVDRPGVCGVGELKFLFGRGVGDRELCGCGHLVVECPLWREVGRQLAGGWDTPAGRSLVELFREVNSVANMPLVLSGRGTMVARARRVLGELYPLVARLTGAELIVDSSKHPAWAFLLSGVDTIDLRVVHLVRHPSAVAYSWSAPKHRPHAAGGDGEQYIPAQPSWEVAFRWDVFNLLFHRLAQRGVPMIRLRYEDYVDNLDGVAKELMAFADRPAPSAAAVQIAEHGIAGNPARFAPAGVTVRRDDRWVTELSPAHHALVSAMSWPVRSRYGYLADRRQFLDEPPVPAVADGGADRPPPP